MSKRLIVIEPHGDDALLSASSIIESCLKSGIPVELYTIGHSRSSEGMKTYWDLSKYEYYDLPEIDYSLRPRINTHEIHRLYKQAQLPRKYVESLILLNKDVSKLYHEVYDQNYRVLKDILKDITPDDILLSPYGLDHPYHILIARIVSREIAPKCNRILYLEKPYLSKRYIQESLRVDEVKMPVSINIEHPDIKEEVFVSVYPTEKSMFRFSKDTLISDPEEYICDRSDLIESIVCY